MRGVRTLVPDILEAVGGPNDEQVHDAQDVAQVEEDQLVPQVHKTGGLEYNYEIWCKTEIF